MAKILGLGNALVDMLMTLQDDSLLETFNLPKGSMQLVEQDESQRVLNGTAHLPRKQASGGSAANTIHGLARLGAQTGFMGKLGQDELGNFFAEDLKKSNISPVMFNGQAQTGVAAALVSPDSERTFATYLGAAVEMTPADLKAELFADYDILHIEGYLVFNQDLVRHAMKMAKEAGMRISIDMASYNVVEANLDFLKEMVEEYVDILFANEEEAKAFTGLDPESALNKIAEMVDIAVVKIGKEGSLIKQDDRACRVSAADAKPIDTTGAGDLYASGFLFGLTNGYDLHKCGEIGTICAGNVIEVIGAHMSDETWTKINGLVGNIKK